MTSDDRLRQLEQQVLQLSSQIAGLIPVRLADALTVAPSSDDFPLVKIRAGSSLDIGQVTGFGTPLTPPPGSTPIIPTFDSTMPTAGKPFAIMLESAISNETKLAAPVGIVAAQLNFTDASHQYADCVTNSPSAIKSGSAGPARILWREKQNVSGSGSLGSQWALVLLSASQPAAVVDIRGWTTSQITAATGSRNGPTTPGTGTAKLGIMPTSGAAGAAWQAGTDNVNVENWMRGTIPIYKPILLDFSRYADDGTKIYSVKSEGCVEIPSG